MSEYLQSGSVDNETSPLRPLRLKLIISSSKTNKGWWGRGSQLKPPMPPHLELARWGAIMRSSLYACFATEGDQISQQWFPFPSSLRSSANNSTLLESDDIFTHRLTIFPSSLSSLALYILRAPVISVASAKISARLLMREIGLCA